MLSRMKISIIYRVQGGAPPNASREYFSLGDDGGLTVQTKRPTDMVYVSDPIHTKYFLLKRSGITKGVRRSSSEFYRDTTDISDKGLHVIRMIVPDWYQQLLRKYEIPQPNSSGDSIRISNRPRLADPGMAGVSHGIGGWWVEALKQSCLSVKRFDVASIKDAVEWLGKSSLNVNTFMRNYKDEDALIKALSRLPLIDEDIKILNQVHGIEVQRSQKANMLAVSDLVKGGQTNVLPKI